MNHPKELSILKKIYEKHKKRKEIAKFSMPKNLIYNSSIINNSNSNLINNSNNINSNVMKIQNQF